MGIGGSVERWVGEGREERKDERNRESRVEKGNKERRKRGEKEGSGERKNRGTTPEREGRDEGRKGRLSVWAVSRERLREWTARELGDSATFSAEDKKLHFPVWLHPARPSGGAARPPHPRPPQNSMVT